MYCLDSCVCIDFLRGKSPDLYKLFHETDPRLIKVPAIVEAELLLGARKSRNPKIATLAVEEFLSPFEILNFGQDCAYEYASIRSNLEAQGKKIGSNDMLIAATAIAHHLTLVTNNVNEFKRIKGIDLEYWEVSDFSKS